MTEVDNAVYDTLGERWYAAKDDPVALLRAEARLMSPWVLEEIRRKNPLQPAQVLDVACGGGFLSNFLARNGLSVTGIDASRESLEVARRHDASGCARYIEGDALRLPFEENSFDAVCAMDFLEHVDKPESAISEASRVLKPGGLFFFHTFNRNWVSRLVAIKGVSWFVKNTPARLHAYEWFIRPDELARFCARHRLLPLHIRGVRPVLSRAFFQLLLTREVPDDFRFCFSSSRRISYSGVAVRDWP